MQSVRGMLETQRTYLGLLFDDLNSKPMLPAELRQALDQLGVPGNVEDVARDVSADAARHEGLAPEAEQALRGAATQPVCQDERDIFREARPNRRGDLAGSAARGDLGPDVTVPLRALTLRQLVGESPEVIHNKLLIVNRPAMIPSLIPTLPTGIHATLGTLRGPFRH